MIKYYLKLIPVGKFTESKSDTSRFWKIGDTMLKGDGHWKIVDTKEKMTLEKVEMFLYEKSQNGDLLIGVVDEFKYSVNEVFTEDNKPEYTKFE